VATPDFDIFCSLHFYFWQLGRELLLYAREEQRTI
jgi:hypothetical protein